MNRVTVAQELVKLARALSAEVGYDVASREARRIFSRLPAPPDNREKAIQVIAQAVAGNAKIMQFFYERKSQNGKLSTETVSDVLGDAVGSWKEHWDVVAGSLERLTADDKLAALLSTLLEMHKPVNVEPEKDYSTMRIKVQKLDRLFGKLDGGSGGVDEELEARKLLKEIKVLLG